MWAGLGHIETNIMAGTGRELDAFFIQHGGNQIIFHQRPLSTTNRLYWLPNLPSGQYEVEYTVVASNFPTVAHTFIVELEQGTDKISFMPAKKGPTTA